jgi:hypothetical protein
MLLQQERTFGENVTGEVCLCYQKFGAWPLWCGGDLVTAQMVKKLR